MNKSACKNVININSHVVHSINIISTITLSRNIFYYSIITIKIEACWVAIFFWVWLLWTLPSAVTQFGNLSSVIIIIPFLSPSLQPKLAKVFYIFFAAHVTVSDFLQNLLLKIKMFTANRNLKTIFLKLSW